MPLGFNRPRARARTSSTCVGMFALALLLLAGATPAPAFSITQTVTLDAGAAPTTFSVDLPVTFPAILAPTTVSITLSGTLTDRLPDGVSLTPTLVDGDTDGLAEIFAVFVGLGSPSIHLVDLGPASSVAGAYGPFSEALTGLGSIDHLRVAFDLTLSALDSAVLVATVRINEPTSSVPWAGGLWLLVGGIGAVSWWRRR